MLNFNYHSPVNLIFGPGKVSLIGKFAASYGKKALIVSGKGSTKRTGLLDRVISYLKEENVEHLVFDKVEPNPLTTTVEEGAVFAKENGCDVVIGLGGGSAMDAAKAIAFAVVNPGDISEYIYGKQGTGALPIIAITTTAGTGSEGNLYSVLTNPVTKDKKSLRTPYIYPKVSIVDPELLTTLPPRVIAATGIDVLCHCVEGYVSKKSHSFTEMMALKGIELITSNLEKVYKNPQDVESWCNVALANTLGGIAIDTAGTTVAHAMEHPLSGLLNVVHGEGLAAVFTVFMEYTYKSAPDKFANISRAMGEKTEGMSQEEAARKSIDAVKGFIEKMGQNVTLKELGVKEEHIDWMAENTYKIAKLAIENNPRVPSVEEIKELYRKCM